jgi:hypothetical protein
VSLPNTSEVSTYALAGAGAASGFLKYYVRPEMTATRGWAAVLALAGLYEVLAPEGELLSEGVDRALEKRKALTVSAIGLVSLHLCNLIPEKYDPLHQGLELIKRLR